MEQEHKANRREQQAVAKGARLLDRILPGWHKRINLKKLDMSNGSLCMMGQLFGTGVEARLAEKMYPEELHKARAGNPEHDGFYIALYRGAVLNILHKLGLSGKSADYRALGRVCNGHDNKCMWATEIAQRLEQDKTAVSSAMTE